MLTSFGGAQVEIELELTGAGVQVRVSGARDAAVKRDEIDHLSVGDGAGLRYPRR